MNIDDLKSNWNSLKFPPGYVGEDAREIVSRVENGRVTTLRDRLGAISRQLSIFCVWGIFIMIPFFRDSPTLAILAICFFIFLGVMHYRAYRRVSSLNFSNMTVKEAIYTVSVIEERRIRLRAVGMTLAFPLTVYMIFTLSSIYGSGILYGCIAGGIIGAILGLLINRRAVSIIREMRSQLNQEEQ